MILLCLTSKKEASKDITLKPELLLHTESLLIKLLCSELQSERHLKQIKAAVSSEHLGSQTEAAVLLD
ncbi:hypothetical protein CesoFtcFv8_019419 [Champsocephalus esox]|uniref:Uncharacterized protein n=2 Tax=Champsocephalus TaxID=52236 RepID=A0AAN8D091_CHAGU|nr:hypothetical protein CesoFtcFv8_019419 [Champsocephalus esox]KAK5910678.1 hypothetical protein CgunFtcFv8_004919 [Champsocephalus gunnari]